MKRKFLICFLTLLLLVTMSAPALAFAEGAEESFTPISVLLDDTSDSNRFDNHARGVLPYGAEVGKRSIIATSNHSIQFAARWSSGVDITSAVEGAEETVFTFWVFIANDKYLSGNGQIELTSSGTNDQQEKNWIFAKSSLEDGGYETGKWNKIELAFSKASNSGDVTLDVSNVNYFRLYNIADSPYNGGSDTLTFVISDMRIETRANKYRQALTVTETREADPVPSIEDMEKPPLMNGVHSSDIPTGADVAMPAGNTFVVNTCDSADQWGAVYVDKRNYVEGKGSIFDNSAVATVNAIFKNLDTSKLPAFEDAYLEMYVYIDDVERMSLGGGHGQIELNSSGVNDICEIFYDFNPEKIALKNGWNFISLKLSEFSPTDGKFVYSKFMGMRVYSICTHGTNTLRVDNITITDAPKIDYIRAHGFTVHEEKPYKIGSVAKATDYKTIESNFLK